MSASIFTTAYGAQIAYHHLMGQGTGVMFLGGFMSDMTGSKATSLEEHCRKAGKQFLRFDYQGHGASSGAFKDGTIGQWAQDALTMFDEFMTGPTILVGSSMGGWIASLLARQRPEKIAGFIGIAAAPDFTERMWAHDLSDDHRTQIMRDGYVEIHSEYGPDPYVFTKALFDDGRTNSIFAQPLKIEAPVRLLQGLEDPDVPYDTALKLANHMQESGSQDVEAIMIPAGDHRLSTEADLNRLCRTVSEIWNITEK